MKWWWDYLRANIASSFHDWGHVETLAAVAVAVLTAAFFGLTATRVIELSWSWYEKAGVGVAIWLALTFGFFIVVRTPMKLWREQKQRADRLEDARRPRLHVEDLAEANFEVMGRGWGMRIRNTGSDVAHGCHGRLEEIEFEVPNQQMSMSRWPKDRDLHWSGQLPDDYEYTISGLQTGMLNLIYWRLAGPNTGIVIAYRGSVDFQLANKIGFDDPFLMLVSISSAGVLPTYAVCRVDPVAVDVTRFRDAPAVQLIWHGETRRNLSEFQRQPQ